MGWGFNGGGMVSKGKRVISYQDTRRIEEGSKSSHSN